MFLNIQIHLLILKTYYGQFTLTTKKSLHIIFKVSQKPDWATIICKIWGWGWNRHGVEHGGLKRRRHETDGVVGETNGTKFIPSFSTLTAACSAQKERKGRVFI